jgi:hypothetical protein
MKKYFKDLYIISFFVCCLQICYLLLPSLTRAQFKPSMDCEGTIRAGEISGYYKRGQCRCVRGQVVCEQPSGKKKSSSRMSSNDINNMVVGMMFQSMLTAMFTDNKAHEQETLAAKLKADAEKQKAAALAALQAAEAKRMAEAEHQKMMQSYKKLDGTNDAGFKSLSQSDLNFKTLDGETETLAANARTSFDAPLALNDPRVVDLRDAQTYVVGNLKKDDGKTTAAQRNKWLIGVISKLESTRDKAEATIQKLESDIREAESVIKKSEELIRQAVRKGDAQAEKLARQELSKAKEGIKKNRDMKDFAEHIKRSADEALVCAKQGEKNLEIKLEQLEFDMNRPYWETNQIRLIEKRGGNAYIDSIYTSLRKNAPPNLPPRKYDMLQPGDVLLISPDDTKSFSINVGDRISSSSASPASHTVLFLKEVNGKKLFLDHNLERGSVVISEEEFLKNYGSREALVAQPVSKVKSEALWEFAKELVRKEAENPYKTNYGLYGDDYMVCSEAARWVLVNSGMNLPETSSPYKWVLGIKYGPANFFDDEYNFVITPLYSASQLPTK